MIRHYDKVISEWKDNGITDRSGTCQPTQLCDEWGLGWQYLPDGVLLISPAVDSPISRHIVLMRTNVINLLNPVPEHDSLTFFVLHRTKCK